MKRSKTEEITLSEEAAQPQKKKRGRWITVLLIVILLAGFGIMFYPTFSNWWNQFHQSRAIANYVAAVEEMDEEVLAQMIADAEAYNERLLSMPNRYLPTDEEVAEYESLLDLTGSGVMGYVQINKIGVNLPIYHGLDESVLQIAIGHIPGTSLPVGGTSTHAVISGHRGLPSARLFTDLDKLEEGDTFTITVLDRVVTYEVDQIRIVEPSDLSNLNIMAGKDYVTLVTCTPYGINTHRLLVRGHRIANIEGETVVLADAVQIPRYIAVPAVGVPLLLAFLIVLVIRFRRRSALPNEEEIAEMLKEKARKSEQSEDKSRKRKGE